jgi:hypothetical protein
VKRIIATLLGSPLVVIGDLGLLAGLALIAFGTFHFGAQAGAPVVVGIMLVVLSSALLLPAISDIEPEEPRPTPPAPSRGGSGLSPAQESRLSVNDAGVRASTRWENVARA